MMKNAVSTGPLSTGLDQAVLTAEHGHDVPEHGGGGPGPSTEESRRTRETPQTDLIRSASSQRAHFDRMSGTGSSAPVAHPPLVSLPSAALPDEVKAAEQALHQAIDTLNKTEESNATAHANAQKTYLTARSNYLNQVARHLRMLSEAPQKPVDPSVRRAAVNTLSAVLGNIIGFTLPTALAGVTGDKTGSALAENLVYAASMGVGTLAGAELGAVVNRVAGGATVQTRLSVPNSANVGALKAIGGDALVQTLSLLVYAIATVSMANNKYLAENTLGQTARTFASGAAMSLIVQPTLGALARNTLTRNGVQHAKELPEVTHNRTIADGVYLREVPEMSNRTTTENKLGELAAAALFAALGAALVFIERQYLKPESGHNSAQAAIDIFGIGLFFAAGQLGKTAFTLFNNDPGRHANKFGIAASKVATEKIHASSLNRFENLLNELGVDLDKGRHGDAAEQTFKDEVAVLSGAVHRERGDMERANTFAAKLGTLAEELMQPASDDAEPVTRQIDATIGKIARTLQTAAQSLNIASESAGEHGEIQPEIKDVLNRLRDVQGLLLQSQFQLVGNEALVQDARITKITDELLPTFAALRKADRINLATNFANRLRDFAVGDLGAEQVVAALGTKAHSRVLAGDIAELFERSGDAQKVLVPSKSLFDNAFQGKPPSLVNSKLLILSNMINTAGAEPADSPTVRARMEDVFGPQRSGDSKVVVAGLVESFVDDFRQGAFSTAQLQEAYVELSTLGAQATEAGAAAGSDLELGVRGAADARTVIAQFEKALGGEFVLALQQEESPSAKATAAGEEVNTGGDMLHALWNDVNGAGGKPGMPAMHRDLLASAMTLALSPGPIDAATFRQHDAHFHPTSYSNKINSLIQHVLFMDRNGIDKTNLAGIPSQVRKMTPDAKYYANSTHGVVYRSHDEAIAEQFIKLPDDVKQRFDVSMTSIDPTDASNIEFTMNNLLRMYPGVFKSIGETTLIKEIISDKNPERPIIASEATRTLLNASAVRGLPLILHCDRGQPGAKDKHADNVLGAIRNWAARYEVDLQSTDPLNKPGAPKPPKIKPKVVWAHGAGISRFTAESSTHTNKLDAMLSEEKLKDVLSIDLSWDFVGFDIMENMHDQMVNEKIPKPLRDGLQNCLKLYKAFTEEGSLADKADDLGDLNLASVHRVAAEATAEKYFAALADFKVRADDAFEKPEVVAAFTRMMKEPGSHGNNWFHIFNKHQDRILFGTDALSVGTKAHGDAAYAMNTRVLNPVYEMLNKIGEKVPELDGISEKIQTTNYMGVFHDPEVAARRAAFEEDLHTENRADHSANARPQQFVTQNDVVNDLMASHDNLASSAQAGLRRRNLTIEERPGRV
jgi:hypothetical protein